MKKAKLIQVTAIGNSVVPTIEFDIELENEGSICRLFAFGGEVHLLTKGGELLLGSLSTQFFTTTIAPGDQTALRPSFELGHQKLDFIQKARNGDDVLLRVVLCLHCARFAPSSSPTLDDVRAEHIHVQRPPNNDVKIYEQEWREILEKSGYGKVKVFELFSPPPPLGTLLEPLFEHLDNAQKKLNEGSHPEDVLTSCRKAFEEYDKLKAKIDLQAILEGKKAENFEELLNKVRNFASGGPHTYWVKQANPNDARLALQITLSSFQFLSRELARL